MAKKLRVDFTVQDPAKPAKFVLKTVDGNKFDVSQGFSLKTPDQHNHFAANGISLTDTELSVELISSQRDWLVFLWGEDDAKFQYEQDNVDFKGVDEA